MSAFGKKILWVDDEIDLLRAHVLLLEQKGYRVETATNGEDAVHLVRNGAYDLVFLDEMMPGIGGLQTLAEMKELKPALPVVLITKNEAESLMDEAIGVKISDYLTKPVNPSQVLLAVKKILEAKKIAGGIVSRDYIQEFQNISLRLSGPMDGRDWRELYQRITLWDLELDGHPELGLRQTLQDQKKESNGAFGKFVERSYRGWVNALPGERPVLSVDVVERFVLPHVTGRTPVFFFVVDCMRLDQWLVMEDLLREFFSVERDLYYSILPTATPYSRNGIFSGLFPLDLEQRFPELWEAGEDDEKSRNRDEHMLLDKLLERKRVPGKPETKYIKILDAEFGKQIEQNILSYLPSRLTAIVVNFVDMLAHGRSDSPLLKEIAPDEAAYRSLTRTWFQHSSLFGMLKTLSGQKDVTIVITTDHGSIRCLHGSKIIGDRETSTNLRYKYGRNLKVDDRQAVFVKNPAEFKLPRASVTTNYVLAREDYYFVYPTDYHRYLNQYRDSFQHGGISMEEMILPVATLRSK
ncbi:MAG: response regulator [Ignavibacteriales bacterium]|nr:response regulator [Ignavibacteriales bacterium]